MEHDPSAVRRRQEIGRRHAVEMSVRPGHPVSRPIAKDPVGFGRHAGQRLVATTHCCALAVGDCSFVTEFGATAPVLIFQARALTGTGGALALIFK
jgi:hypothetical protein